MKGLGLDEIQSSLRSGRLEVRSLIDHYLSNIKANTHLNAFLNVYEDDVDNYINRIQSKLEDNPEELGRLFGCVVSLKDNICYKDHPCQAGSKMLDGYKSPFSATVVQRLIAEDAFIIGSTNCDEFGMGSTSENPYFGAVRNGWDDQLIAGGSSGGSAVSVQMDMCLIGVGSDTGGSVRQPSAYTGTIGFKPSYGHLSRYGLIAYGSSFDQIGLIGRDVRSISQVYEYVRGSDDFDATCIAKDHDFVNQSKVGVLYVDGIENNLLYSDYKAYIDRLKAGGVDCKEIKLSYIDELVSVYYILVSAEATTNLRRYDGVRYGRRSEYAEDLDQLYRNSRSEGFGPEVKQRVLMGTFVLNADYLEAYYNQAQRLRRMIQEEITQILQDVDYLITPTVMTPPWKIGTEINDPTEIYKSDLFTVLPNICGLPAISIPIKDQEKRSKYSAFQLIGKRNNDKKLLKLAELA